MASTDNLLTRGVIEIIQMDSLQSRLHSGKKLTVKLGIDPTNKQLHLGHYLVLQKLREFQEAGHQAVLVIGDFTAMVGDPSGRDTKRVALTKQEIEENMREYSKQAAKIIDLEKAKIVYNSSWFSKLGLEGIIELASKATFGQIMERKEFKERLKKDELSLLESFYPLLQAYDSVMLKSDVEIGGLDQKLNLLMGRQIQKRYGHKEQDIVLTPLLVGLDGKEKMSKSVGNYIAFDDLPEDIFGKVMSIPDSLMEEYFNYCTRVPAKQIETLFGDLSTKKIKPMELKKKLASEIVKIYYGEQQAQKAQLEFERVFQKGERTAEVKVVYQDRSVLPTSFASLAAASGATASTSEAIRLAENKGLKFDGKVVTNPHDKLSEPVKNETIIDVGKRKSVKIIWK